MYPLDFNIFFLAHLSNITDLAFKLLKTAKYIANVFHWQAGEGERGSAAI